MSTENLYNSIKIDNKSYKILKHFADKQKISMKDIITLLVNFLSKNPTLLINGLSSENFKFENDVVTEIFKKNKKFIREETNRLIGFIKVQDEFLNQFKNDIMFKISNDDNPEFHPLFSDYDMMLKYIYIVLEKRGITNKNIKDDILQIFGQAKLNSFLESETRTQVKSLKI